ncbi:MAG TPA: hypothetical protein PKO22_07710 [Treponemataceae bacterium]|nr:hypothetical protein [Treponemataceae bacterium]
MTDLQPTEIELTGKKKRRSKRKIFAVIFLIVFVAAIAVLTALLANRASKSPQMVQPQAVPTEELLPGNEADTAPTP